MIHHNLGNRLVMNVNLNLDISIMANLLAIYVIINVKHVSNLRVNTLYVYKN